MSSQKNISLIVGIAIPIFMIVLIAVSIYLPSFFAPAPQYNFLYATEDYYGREYGVEKGTLVKYEVKYPEHHTPSPAKLFVYDVSAKAEKEILFEEGQKLKLDQSTKSPDGYEVVYGSSEYGFFPLFFSGGRDYNAMYLKGHNTSKKLELLSSADGSHYYGSRHFLGWIR
jgi:hypothetical protein